MDFDGAIVLFDGPAIVTRTELSISLEHDDETLCHWVAARRSEWVGTKGSEDVRLPCVLLPGRAWLLHALRVQQLSPGPALPFRVSSQSSYHRIWLFVHDWEPLITFEMGTFEV
jgi:hypothetical protein